ncbi:MAG: hypothetical protein BWX74_00684 [Tenericutes bacterium ADurb.Bin087]|nr:MAG: hypothetical protein BWX74_00684 [Tenericutes bacterium ADurb.Bin087]
MKLNSLSRTHQLVLGALMGAINVIFALVSSYLFAFSLLIMLFLPLASIIVAINIELKYYPVYLLGTLALALVLNLGNIDNTLFFLLPILTSGLAFGLLIKYNIPDIIILLVVSGINLLTTLITIPIINLIYDINFLAVFATFIGFNNLEYGALVLPSILTLLAVMQTLITLVIVTQDAALFRLEINTNYWPYVNLVNLVFSAQLCVISLFFVKIGLALLFIVILLMLYQIIHLFKKHLNLAWSTLLAAIILAIVGIAIFENYTPFPFYFGIIFAFIPVVISDVLWLYISRKKDKEQDEGTI